MRIDLLGLYETQTGHAAWVEAIKGKFAVGFVGDDPVIWNRCSGVVWTGTLDHEIVAMKGGTHFPVQWTPIVNSQEVPPAKYEITKPGFYRTLEGNKVEVLSCKGGYAFGLTSSGAPAIWFVNNGTRCVQGKSMDLGRIVDEWKDPPISKSAMIYLVKSRGCDAFISSARSSDSYVLGKKEITITEGEGL